METFGYTSLIKETKKIPIKSPEIEKIPGEESVNVNEAGILSFSIDNKVKTDESSLISNYREIAKSPEIDLALQEILNEVLIFDVDNKKAFEIFFDDQVEQPISENIKKKILNEFNNVYKLLEFEKNGYEIFRKWYVDSKLFVLKLVAEKDQRKNGISKILFIDPLKIKKVSVIPKADEQNGLIDLSKIEKYYIFTDKSESNSLLFQKGYRIDEEWVSYIDSGWYEEESNQVLGFLYKAIVPFNNLRLMEDSLLIYRVARAPERRAFYIDVGNLPKNKAEEYIKALMNKFKTKLVYDSKTGTILDKKNVLSMVEDLWLPRREGRGTEIETLPGGENLGVTEDIKYFKKKLYQSLNVPLSRFDDDQNSVFQFGKTNEINRDEYRFKKFIDKLRNRFVFLIEDILKTQLFIKNIISPDDWDNLKESIKWKFTDDNYFVEFKEQELLDSKLSLLERINNFVGEYYTKEWVMQNILKHSEEDINNLKSNSKEEPEPGFTNEQI